jgi:hypothetical protein
MGGMRRMTACRLRATRSERLKACHDFMYAPSTAYSFTLTPVWKENGGMG